MASYSLEGNRTASATLGVWSMEADTAIVRRMKITEASFGSEASAADGVFLWKIQRVTAAGSAAGTTATPNPLDEADAAAVADCFEALTTNPTVGVTLLSVPLNQRATFRWVARPGQELVSPAAAEDGFIANTPTASTVAVTSTVFFTEE